MLVVTDTRCGYPAAVLILTGRRGEELDAWIATASAGDQCCRRRPGQVPLA